MLAIVTLELLLFSLLNQAAEAASAWVYCIHAKQNTNNVAHDNISAAAPFESINHTHFLCGSADLR